jgi:glycine cleavage system transcriptional repressor
MPQHYALTAVGPDQEGILEALTEPLVRLSCNLEDLSATILGGHFSLMLMISAPDDVGPDQLLREVRARCGAFELDIRVDSRALPMIPAPPQATHVLSAYGADKPGIVHRVAQFMAQRGINMLDLKTQVVGRPGRPIYAMLLEVLVPETLAAADLRRDLDALGGELSVDVSLRPIEER